ncbi:transcriptional regulator [Sphingobium sp. TA15]|uniref:GntR-family transcriptional regulator n=3 Tax=Sphingobium indicum TaxID=332055 RepID=D4Z898_SPHIU|nr:MULTISPECIES: GntR family transcriptional regulator [Sphingobium]EPR15253.1 GntR family transcriptional regulator [Sphingobium indicum IP26]KEY99296.1 GntR family transcriptional regulator [Sphingomonas sp. BHC-A]BDD68767.1 transcriptional regulator [Sphingobium sp. TA15]APL95099.1 GntR family transcriptional regulator [Sphingobium indicum B90A]EQB03011.1 GntR family transcriptional regulator [Sphingobium sp. HDIP04]
MSYEPRKSPPAESAFATHTEAAARLLSDAILSGDIAPGTRLNIRALSEGTGLGPTPIREALANLAGRGLVTFAGQRGFRVVPVSPQDLQSIMTARTVVEQGALALSMDRGTEDWEVEIVASLHRLKMFTDNPPTDIDKRIDTFERVHWRFHLSLIGACGSDHLIAIYQDLYEQTRRYRSLMLKTDVDPDQAYEKHSLLAQFCLSRDKRRALEMLSGHNNMLLSTIYGPVAEAAEKV